MMSISLLFSLLKQGMILNYNKPAPIPSLREEAMGVDMAGIENLFQRSMSVI